MSGRTGEYHAAEVWHRVRVREVRIAMRVEPHHAGIGVAFRHYWNGGEPCRATSHGEDDAITGAQRSAQGICERMQIAARGAELFVPGGGGQWRLRPADERGIEAITARQQCAEH